MALHAVMVQLQQIEILGCNLCDQSKISCASKAMGGTRYVSAADVSYAENNTELCQLPAELSDARINVGSTDNIHLKTPTRKKKGQSKAKLGRKLTKEVIQKERGSFDGIQPCVWMKWVRVKPVENNTLYGFVNAEWRDLSCLESNIPCKIRRAHYATQQPNSRKRVAIWKKKVKSPNTTISLEPEESHEDNPLSGKNGLNLQVPQIRSDNSKVESANLQLTQDHHHPVHASEGFQHLMINAQMVEQYFTASYTLQLASESIQEAIGYPIAEFERLICSAAPLITYPSLCKLHDQCSQNQLHRTSVCKDHISKISLQSIWNWYEEPGNYGLKVTVDDPEKRNTCFADAVSFHAHFVPLLSAVQLFGYQNKSKEAKSQPLLLDHCILMSRLEVSLMSNALVDRENSMPINQTTDICIGDEKEPPFVAEPALLGNADLIFEFFESEQPQRRMPLHYKIRELANGGTNNNQVVGDPSKLECTNLDDLHPASWFSVAWYPVYRIPEGKLRAAFLTYHSLGHMVQRCSIKDSLDEKTGCVLPVIGLQSYNAQSELWFSPNSKAESPFNVMTNTLVEERLRTLEENALGFARGMVYKDNVTVSNRQPDYEFFMSRNQ